MSTPSGIDLVAMCVNDLVCQGAEPLFFLDYFATGKLDVDQAARGDRGDRGGLRAVGLRADRRRDGRDAGHVCRRRFRPRGLCRRRDGTRAVTCRRCGRRRRAAGPASDGVHSNGYSLVRKVVEVVGRLTGTPPRPLRTAQLGAALLTPTRLYVTPGAGGDPGGRRSCAGPYHRRRADREPAARAARGSGRRDRPVGLDVAAGFRLAGTRPAAWRRRNCSRPSTAGIGMVLVVDADRAAPTSVARAAGQGETVFEIGHVVVGARACLFGRAAVTQRVAILISGGGSNMVRWSRAWPAIIRPGRCWCCRTTRRRRVLRKAGRLGRSRPRRSIIGPLAGTARRSRRRCRRRWPRPRPDILCLAGFMRILTPGFIRAWQGRMLNIHPSLLPKYNGLHTHAARARRGRRRGRLHRP